MFQMLIKCEIQGKTRFWSLKNSKAHVFPAPRWREVNLCPPWQMFSTAKWPFVKVVVNEMSEEKVIRPSYPCAGKAMPCGCFVHVRFIFKRVSYFYVTPWVFFSLVNYVSFSIHEHELDKSDLLCHSDPSVPLDMLTSTTFL